MSHKLNKKIRDLLDPQNGMRWEYNQKGGKLITDTMSYQDSIVITEFGKSKWYYNDKFLGLVKLSFLTTRAIKKSLRGSNIKYV